MFVIDPNFQPVDYWTNFNGTDLLGLVYNDTKRSVILFTNYSSSTLESNDSGIYLCLAASLWSAAHKIAKYQEYPNPKQMWIEVVQLNKLNFKGFSAISYT